MKRSAGFTLIEMLITIAVASTITLAASGALLHVFQTQRIGFEESKHQAQFRMTGNFIERALEDETLDAIVYAGENKSEEDSANTLETDENAAWALLSNGNVLLAYHSGVISAGGILSKDYNSDDTFVMGTNILDTDGHLLDPASPDEKVSVDISKDLKNVKLYAKAARNGGTLITVKYATDTSNGAYTTSYYYRTKSFEEWESNNPGGAALSSLTLASARARQLNSSAAVVRAAVPFSTTGSVVAEKQAAALLEETRNAVGAEARLQFLEALWSQYGSTGMILDAAHQPTDQSFASWYDGTWPDSTPWCACYLSWALYRARGGIEGTPLRFASIKNGIELLSREDGAFGHFYTGFKTARYASPGDILFFDWEGDGDPDHVGAVLTRGSDVVYTVEGNSAHAVALREYKLDDPHICGLGTIPWRAAGGSGE